MFSRRARLGFAAAITLLAGCVGPGLEPPGKGAADGEDFGGRAGSGEPVGGKGGTTGTDSSSGHGDGGAVSSDAGVENADATSNSNMDDDAGS